MTGFQDLLLTRGPLTIVKETWIVIVSKSPVPLDFYQEPTRMDSDSEESSDRRFWWRVGGHDIPAMTTKVPGYGTRTDSRSIRGGREGAGWGKQSHSRRCSVQSCALAQNSHASTPCHPHEDDVDVSMQDGAVSVSRRSLHAELPAQVPMLSRSHHRLFPSPDAAGEKKNQGYKVLGRKNDSFFHFFALFLHSSLFS